MRRCAVTGETVSAEANSFPYDRILGHNVGAGKAVSILSVSIPGRERSIGVVTLVRNNSYVTPQCIPAPRREWRPCWTPKTANWS